MANYIGMYQYLWHPTPLFIFICVSVVRAFQGLKYSQNYMFSYEVLEFIVFCGCIYYLKALVPPPPWGLNQKNKKESIEKSYASVTSSQPVQSTLNDQSCSNSAVKDFTEEEEGSRNMVIFGLEDRE